MRILHTSDWHLGRQFHNVSLLEDQQYVLTQLVSIITEQKIDVVLLAGDIYDRAVPPADAVALLDNVIEEISQQLNIPIILISGNHDSAQRLSFGSRQLAKCGVHIVGLLNETPQPITINDEHGDVLFYGIPYADPAHVKSVLNQDVRSHEEAMRVLTDQIESHNKNNRCVVLAHCFIDGGTESDSERPLSVGGADRVPFDLFSSFNYTALGHLHGPQYKGQENIRYSGSILKYSFSETNHKKSVTIIEMDKEGECVIEKVLLNPLRDMRILEGTLEDILLAAKEDNKSEDYILARLLDKHALFEPMAKLRAVYPNILQIEKPNLNQGGERNQLKRENLKKGELPMFLDFYQQMTNETLDESSTKIVASLLDKIHLGAEK